MAPRKQKELPLLLIRHLCSQEKDESNQTMEITEAWFKMCVCVHTNASLATITALFFKERDTICQQIDLWLCP